MYWRGFIVLSLLLCGSQGLGEEPPEDLLNAAIQETEKDESSVTEEKEEGVAQTNPANKTPPYHSEPNQSLKRTVSSSEEQNFDLGDVILTVSEREMEETPDVYKRKRNRRGSTVLNVRKKPERRTSSIRSQKKRQQETPSEQ